MTENSVTFGVLNGPCHMPIQAKVERLIIFFHGYGANGDDLFGLAAPLIQASGIANAAVWSPNAPDTLPGMDGPLAPMKAYQWFPISTLAVPELTRGVTTAGPIAAAAILAAAQHFDLDLSQVMVMGFSQGGMVAIEACTQLPTAVAGVVGMSTAYLGQGREADITAKPPVVLVHGDADAVVPAQSMAIAETGLTAAGIDVETTLLPDLAHGIDDRAFQVLAHATTRWLQPSG